jgi:hypothetical protein
VQGSVSQTVDGFQAGHNYTITFLAAGRPAGGGCTDNCTELNFSVFVESTDVLDVVAPPTTGFQKYTTNVFTVAESATITFQGTVPTSTDSTSFIDQVSIQDPCSSTGPTPAFTADSVVNGASFVTGGIVPGEIATVFGTNLTTSTGINLTSGLGLSRTF